MALVPRPSALKKLQGAPESPLEELLDPQQQRPKPDAPAVQQLPDNRRKKLDWIGKAAGWVLPMDTWTMKKGIPAVGKVASEAVTDFYNLFNVVEDPTLGIDPVTKQPRKNFGGAILARQLFPMLKTDWDTYWDTDKLEGVREMMAAFGAYGPSSKEFLIKSEQVKAQSKALAESSFSVSLVNDYLAHYGSWGKFVDTAQNHPDRLFTDLADLGVLKFLSPKIASILRKSTPDNLVTIVEQTEDALRAEATKYLQDVHPEMLDNTGNPIKVFHGSPEREAILDEGMFSKEALGDRTGAMSAREGFFFTDNQDVARSYGVDEDTFHDLWDEDTISDLIDEKSQIGDWDEINNQKENWEADIETLSEVLSDLETDKRAVYNEMKELREQHGITTFTWEGVRDALYELEIEELDNKVSELDSDWDDINDEMGSINDEIKDFRDEIKEAEEQLSELERLDNEIEAHEGIREEALWTVQSLETIEAYLIMRNPMIFEQQVYNESLTDTIRKAKANGHDGVIIKQMYDPYYPLDPTANYVGNHYIVFEPAQIVNAETGLQMGPATDLVSMMNLLSGRQLQMNLFTPEGINLPPQVANAIEKADANSYLASFYAALLLDVPVKKISGEDVTPNDVARYLMEDRNTTDKTADAKLLDHLIELRQKYPEQIDNMIEKYKDILPQEFADEIQTPYPE